MEAQGIEEKKIYRLSLSLSISRKPQWKWDLTLGIQKFFTQQVS